MVDVKTKLIHWLGGVTKNEHIFGSSMSEKEKAEFFKRKPFKIVSYE